MTVTVKRSVASSAERYTAEDLEKAGRIIKRENLTIPHEVIDYLVAAGVERLDSEQGVQKFKGGAQ